MGDTLKKIQYTVNESEDSDNDWVSVDIVLADGRAFQVWIDGLGISVAIHSKKDGFWEPTGVSPCWDDLKAQPIKEESQVTGDDAFEELAEMANLIEGSGGE